MTRDTLSEQIAAAARDMESESTPETTMDAAVKLSLQLVPKAQEAGISLLQSRGQVESRAATSETMRRLDDLQLELNEGPCLDAVRERLVVESPDVRTDDRWPRWGPAAAETTGVRSMLCFRLFTHGDRVGSLNLFSTQTGAFDDDDREQGLAFAAHVAVAVVDARAVATLKAGIDTRTVIGQATGILMASYHLDATRAFAVLTRLSSHNNRKVRDLAYEVVTTGLLPRSTSRDQE